VDSRNARSIEVLGTRLVEVNELNEQAVGFYLPTGFKVKG